VKSFGVGLREFLLGDQVESFYTADLFEVETSFGMRLYATDGQLPITYNGNVYEPVKYGIWHRKSVTTKLGMTSSSMTFGVMADDTPMQGNMVQWPDGTTRSTTIEFSTDNNYYPGAAYPAVSGNDYFYSRFSGIIQPSQSGSYIFGLYADDGAQVYINGKALDFQYVNGSGSYALQTAAITLVADSVYNLVIWNNNDGLVRSGVQLTWTPPKGNASLVTAAPGTYFSGKIWKMNGPSTQVGLSPAYPVNGREVVVPNDFNIPMMQAMQLGLFDGAKITVYTTYMPDYGDLGLGVEIKYSGQITELGKTGRSTAEGTAESYLFKLNQQMPRMLMQPACRWILGDAGCTLDLSGYTQQGVVSAQSTSLQIIPQIALAQADGYFSQGVITMTSGQNMNLSMSVKQYKGGVILLTKPFLFPVQAGDKFQVVAGCDHTYATCQQKFSNLANFGGMPWIPNYERSI
jgi:uncharacterized phage protein (TIGR02218 family)